MVALVLTGCSGPSSAPKPAAQVSAAPAPVAPPADPAKALYEQVRAGVYQYGAASDAIDDALDTARDLAKTADGDAKQSLLDVVDFLNDAGGSLGDHTDDPKLEDFRQDFAGRDDERKKAISDGNDALEGLLQAQNTARDLVKAAPAPLKDDTQDMLDNIDTAVDAVRDGIHAYGGEVRPGNDPRGES